jgi:5-carboxymethyl-2-hydroxymuconate isomerase
MPHFFVEYSANLEDEIAIDALFETLHSAAAATGVFPLGGIRSRGVKVAQYRIADGHPDNAFVHLVIRVGHGRDVETLRQAGEVLFAVVTDHLARIFEARPLAISMEMQEIHPTLTFKKNNLHQYVKARRTSNAAA